MVSFRRENTVDSTPRISLAGALITVVCTAVATAAPPEDEGWLASVSAAQSAAREDGRLIFVDLWADWCSWCKKLEEEVFSTPTFQDFAKNFVLLRVNTEDEGEGARLQADFGIVSLPTTLLLDANLVKVGELQGFAPTEPYIQNLELERAMFQMLVRSYDNLEESADRDMLKTLADDFHARRDGARASELYRRLLTTVESGSEDDVWNRFYYADSLRLQGAFEDARLAQAQVRGMASELHIDELIELNDLLSYHIAHDARACLEAQSALEAFVSEHPDGIFIRVAEDALESIGKERECA